MPVKPGQGPLPVIGAACTSHWKGVDDRASLRTRVRQHRERAVTRGIRNCAAFFFSDLRLTRSKNAACCGNDAFDGMNLKRDDCALSRTQRRVGSAPLQALVPVPTRWGLTTPHRGRWTAPLYPLSIDEKYRFSKKLSSDGAVWTAYRSAPARVLETLLHFYLASMSQLRSSVLVTPLCATAPRLDLNTYRLFGTSSPMPTLSGRLAAFFMDQLFSVYDKGDTVCGC
jgi:hypothetical protein